MGRVRRDSFSWLSGLIFLFHLPVGIYAQYGLGNYTTNHFLNPPTAGDNGDFSNNPAYEIGNILDIRWTTDFPELTVTLFQVGRSDRTPNLVANQSLIRSFDWLIDVSNFQIDGVNASTGVPLNVFYLYMYPRRNYTGGVSSLYFNLTYPSAANGNSRLTATAVDSSSPTTTYSEPPATYTSTPAMPTGRVLPSGAALPVNRPQYRNAYPLLLGLVLGLGIPTIIGLGVLGYCLVRRRQKAREASTTQNASSGGGTAAGGGSADSSSSSPSPRQQQQQQQQQQQMAQASGGSRDAGMQIAQQAVPTEYYAPSADDGGARTAVYREHFAPPTEADGVRSRDFAAQPTQSGQGSQVQQGMPKYA